MKVSLRIKSVIAASALVLSAFAPAPANAVLALPKLTWQVCSNVQATYCVESVSIQSLGSPTAEALTWVPAGTITSSSASISPTLPGVSTSPGANLAGMWTNASWSQSGRASYGYDGVSVDIRPANAFVNHLFFTVQPVKYDPATGSARKAMSSTYANHLADLNLDDRIIIKVRTGGIVSGVAVGFANNLSFTWSAGLMTFSGTPVPTPQASSKTQCSGETGVASAIVSGIQGFVVVENDDMGFGVDGLSGRMFVASNGTCETSTPVWEESSRQLSWTVGAPHFAPDGTTVNRGFYKAVIPANDALLLWGLSNPRDANLALSISVTEEAGGPAVSVRKVSFLNGNIVVDVSGFEYSKPKLIIKPNLNYKKWVKLATFKCRDFKTKKIVTVKRVYGCPAGTRKA